jgi:hypothetical protein
MTTTYHALVFFDKDETGTVYRVDVIDHLGAFWLVPAWFEYPKEKQRSPARIISLLTLQHQDIPNTSMGILYLTYPNRSHIVGA